MKVCLLENDNDIAQVVSVLILDIFPSRVRLSSSGPSSGTGL